MQYPSLSTHILIRHHEIALKGKNRPEFEKRLVENIQRVCAKAGPSKIEKLSGRYLIEVNSNTSPTELISNISYLGGVAAVGPCLLTEDLSVESLEQKATAWFNQVVEKSPTAKTFAVRTRRTKQDFTKSSVELDQIIGSKLHQLYPNLKVDLKNAELVLNIEVRNRHAVIYSSETKGALGLPMDKSQRVVCLLSGGIDSPVAAFELMARGCTPVFVHFHSQPFTSVAATEKVKKLAQILAEKSPYPLELWLVPLLKIQKAVRDICNERYRTVHYRRFMLKVAEELAHKRWAKAIVTGESLGQVASQTLTNINSIQSGIDLPVFRPLISLNKGQIIEKAKKLGTYELSLEPHEDTCILFAPKRPSTQAKLEHLKFEEDKLPTFKLIFDAIDHAEKILLQ